MIIDFKNMEETASENFKGGEGVLYRKGHHDDMGKIIWLRIPQGSSIGYHTHETDCEVMYIVSGRARCIDDGEERELKAGDVHYCPQGHSHCMMNRDEEDLVIFGVLPEN